MTSSLFLIVITFYFGILLVVAWMTGRKGNNAGFFQGNKNSNWMLVAFGMIGTSLSGVTFVSVPGAVGLSGWSYLQIGIGYFAGYFLVAFVLLPLYYRLGLVSIYTYLQDRFGIVTYKTGAAFFIVSRLLGATARLYLVVNILHEHILQTLNIPFEVTTLIILFMILLYTFQGGVKTIVWTDTLQTFCMLAGLVACIFFLLHNLHVSLPQAISLMRQKQLCTVFHTDPDAKSFFLKQIIGGIFITLTMTGMDQEMMQKNISVAKLGDAQKNMASLAFVMLLVILMFLFLGSLLYLYAGQLHLDLKGDKIFPAIALHQMPVGLSLIFIIALISALFPSADGAITALTASFYLDILGIHKSKKILEGRKENLRKWIHSGMALLFLAFVLLYRYLNNPSMIDLILKIATYTYGPLLGLFSFGILSKRTLRDGLSPIPCLLSPLICFLIDHNQSFLFGKFSIGLELLLLNGIITFIGCFFISQNKPHSFQ